MMEAWNVEGKRVRICLRNGYRYAGPVQHESPAFLTLLDEKENAVMIVAKQDVLTVQVLQ